MTTKAKPAILTKETEQKLKSTQKYKISQLRANCRVLFGISTSTFDGATYGLTGTYTIKEMQAHIDTWKKKGVK